MILYCFQCKVILISINLLLIKDATSIEKGNVYRCFLCFDKICMCELLEFFDNIEVKKTIVASCILQNSLIINHVELVERLCIIS